MRLALLAILIICATGLAFAQPLAEVGHYGENIGTIAIDGTNGVLNEGTSLRVVDVSNPTAPSFKGSAELGTVPTGMFVAENYAYVAGYTGPFSVVDISNINAPSISGSIDWEAWKNAVWVRRGGDYAYLGVCSTVEVIDVRNKTAPSRVRSLGAMESCVESITGDGGYLYVATDGPTTRVRIYSLVTPTNPVLLSTIPGNSAYSRRWNSLAVFGDVLYVGQEDGTHAYDIADRTSPRLIGRVETEDRFYDTTLDVDRGLLYVADWAKLDVWQLASPDAPAPFKSIEGGPQHQVRQIAAFSGVALAARTHALTLANTSAGTSTDVRALTPGTGWGGAIATKDDLLYLGTGPGIAVLDISNPTQPQLLQLLSTSWTGDLEVVGSTLYNASPWGVLQVYDVTTPSAPIYLADYPISGAWGTLRLSGTPSLVAATASDLLVIYSRNPDGTLTLRSSTPMPTGANAVAVAGTIAYVALTDGTLRAYNLSNPALPSLTTTRTVFANTGSGFNAAAEVSGDRLHLLYGRKGYAIVDISAPANPTVLGTFTTTELEGSDIAVDGNIVYLATFGWHGRQGIRALNVSSTSSIQEIASIRGTGLTWSVLIAGGYLYSAEDRGALRVRNLATIPDGLGASGFVIH
ncbi:MAG: hypothetical protein RLY93_05050 [Sumerlaeia bacterium]